MNRMEEYRSLQAELERPPAQLEGTVRRAQARQRREARRRRAWWTSCGTAAAAFALFVVLVNVSSPFAAACESIPILKDLAAAVSFSHSLSSAVDHGYVQSIGQSRSSGGVTVDLDYMMLDGGQAVFFGRVTAPEGVEHCQLVPEIRDASGNELLGYALMSSTVTPGTLSTLFTIAITPEEFAFPEVLDITCAVELRWAQEGNAPAPAHTAHGQEDDPHSPKPDATVEFELYVDDWLLQQGRSIPVEQWFEVDGNRFYIASLELYPTFAKFELAADGNNRETLQTLDYYLEDERGNRYERGSASGLLAMGDSYWFESPYFQQPEHLTLHITSASWMEKGRERARIDLETGQALTPLPEGILPTVGRENSSISVGLTAPLGRDSTENHHAHYQLFGGHYYAPDGTAFEITRLSSYSGVPVWDEAYEQREALYDTHFTQTICLEDWAWDTVEIELYFSRRAEYPQPLSLRLF